MSASFPHPNFESALDVLSPDPFLRAHEFRWRCYDISSGVHPVSVRDQMVRAQMLVQRLISNGILAPGKRLLVVGGGVSGIVAALWATEQKVDTLLIEREKTLFSRFARCNTRQIDPTLYEWPAPIWNKNAYQDGVAVEWNSKVASELVVDLNDAANKISSLIHCGTRLSGMHFVDQLYQVSLDPAPEEEIAPFDVIIFATGVGTEKVESGNFKGQGFWDNDKWTDSWDGSKNRPKILIAGAGDGGLQDFIRVLTGCHPYEVICTVDKVLNMVDEAHSSLETKLIKKLIWKEVQEKIFFAQMQAERYHQWGTEEKLYAENSKAYCTQLDKVFVEQIDIIREQCNWSALVDSLKNLILNKRIFDGRKDDETDVTKVLPEEIVLVYLETHIPWCFALNRFLVHLLHSCFEDKVKIDVRSTCKLSTDSIVCHHEGRDCSQGKHKVATYTYEVKIINGKEEIVWSRDNDKEFDSVLLRFGLKRDETNIMARAPLQRQLLPIHPQPDLPILDWLLD